MDETKARVRTAIIEGLMLDMAADDLGDDDDLSATLGIDSVGFLEVLASLEEEFDIQIHDPMVTRHSTGTVRRLADLVVLARGDGQ